MGKRSLLLVDGDASSLRVLEVSLRKAGFNVTTALTADDALSRVRSARPDLVISATRINEDLDGFDFCAELKGNAEWREIPFILVAEQDSLDEKIRGLELGVEDYLVKPLYIKEIITRVRILLQKRERSELEEKKDNRTRFAGSLSDMGVVDLLQTIELSRKSGLIHISAPNHRQATIYFRDGVVVDAEAGRLQGEDAVYRLLTWSDGSFEVLFRNVRRRDVVNMSTQGLLMEGMRRLDEWGRLLEQLPAPKARFRLDFEELAIRLPDLPDELNAILRLFDGRRTLLDIIDESEFSDLEALEIISRLYFEGVVCELVEGEEPQLAARFDRMELAPRTTSRSRHSTSKDTIPVAVPPPIPPPVAEVDGPGVEVAGAARDVAAAGEDAVEGHEVADAGGDRGSAIRDDDAESSAAFGRSLIEAAGGDAEPVAASDGVPTVRGQSLIDEAIGSAAPVVDEESGRVLAQVANFVAEATAVEVATWNDRDELADGMVTEGARVLDEVGDYDEADAQWFQPKRPESEADFEAPPAPGEQVAAGDPAGFQPKRPESEAEPEETSEVLASGSAPVVAAEEAESVVADGDVAEVGEGSESAREAVAVGDGGVPSPIQEDADVGRVSLRGDSEERLAPIVELRSRRRNRTPSETARMHPLGGVVSSLGEDKASASGELEGEEGHERRKVEASAVELEGAEEDIVELDDDDVEELAGDDIETLDDEDVEELADEDAVAEDAGAEGDDADTGGEYKSAVKKALGARRRSSREVLIPKAPPPLRPPDDNREDEELEADDVEQLRRERARARTGEGGVMWTAIIAGALLVGLLAVAYKLRPGGERDQVAMADAAVVGQRARGPVPSIDPVVKPDGDRAGDKTGGDAPGGKTGGDAPTGGKPGGDAPGGKPGGDAPTGGKTGGDAPTGGKTGGDAPGGKPGGKPGGDATTGGKTGGDAPTGGKTGGDATGGQPGGDSKPSEDLKKAATEARAALAKARKLRGQGKHQAALGKVNEAISKRGTASALVLKADILLKLRDPDGALGAASSAVKRAPGSASAWRMKGVIHLELGQNGPAKQSFEKYLELRPRAGDRKDIQTLIDSL